MTQPDQIAALREAFLEGYSDGWYDGYKRVDGVAYDAWANSDACKALAKPERDQ